MPMPKAIRGKLLLIESVMVVGILLSISVHDLVSNYGGEVGPIANHDIVLSSPLRVENYTAISTGEITGYNIGDGTFTYNVGLFVANNSTIGKTAGSSDGIPIYVMAWLDYSTTRNLTSLAGYIQYERINISYMSSYLYFENASGHNGAAQIHVNSYASSVSGGFNSTRRGTITTRESTYAFTGTPKPEENVIVNRTYSSTLPNLEYSYGISVPGKWIISRGPQNENSLALLVTEKIGIVDSVSDGIFGKTLRETHLVLTAAILAKYTPNDTSWHYGADISGAVEILKLGSGASSNISLVMNSTVKKPYF